MSKNSTNARIAANDAAKQPANAPSAPPAKPEASAAPAAGGKKGKGKKEKKTRVAYAIPEGGLTEWPADFDPKKHKPLARAAFKDETVWLDKKATLHEEAAKKLREEAENIRTLGPSASSAKARKLLKVQNELDELRAMLAAQGVDPDVMLAKKRAEKEAAAAKEPKADAPAK